MSDRLAEARAAWDAADPALARGSFDAVLHLTDPVYWGGPTGDERYLVVSPR